MLYSGWYGYLLYSAKYFQEYTDTLENATKKKNLKQDIYQ